MLRESLAFLKRDFLLESSYRLPFLSNIFLVLASVLSYFYIDKLFGHKIVPHLEEYGTNYFSYVLIGMAFFSYVGVGLSSFSAKIQQEQITGTLEAVLLTPVRVQTMLFSMAVWNIVCASLDMLIYICLGVFIFKTDFSQINIISTLVIMLLTISSFSGLGILSGSFVLIYKRGSPISWIINSLEGLAGGVYFPITILPLWLQITAKFLPITHAIRGLQLAVHRGYSVFELKAEITFLFLFSVILLPLSFRVFRYALNKARLNGSLSKY